MTVDAGDIALVASATLADAGLVTRVGAANLTATATLTVGGTVRDNVASMVATFYLEALISFKTLRQMVYDAPWDNTGTATLPGTAIPYVKQLFTGSYPGIAWHAGDLSSGPNLFYFDTDDNFTVSATEDVSYIIIPSGSLALGGPFYARQSAADDLAYGVSSYGLPPAGLPFAYVGASDFGPIDFSVNDDYWHTHGITAVPGGQDYPTQLWNGLNIPAKSHMLVTAALFFATVLTLPAWDEIDAPVDVEVHTSLTPPDATTAPTSRGALSDPVAAPALSRVAGGDLLADTYDYCYQAWQIDPVHHTAASPVASLAVADASAIEVDIPDVLDADGYRVFRRGSDDVWVYVGDVEVLV